MGVRIGSAHFMYNYQVALNNAYQKQTKLFEQSDGSSLHRASDNPMDYSKLLRYTVSDNENEQYRDGSHDGNNADYEGKICRRGEFPQR